MRRLLLALVVLAACVHTQVAPLRPIRALILDGQNNRDWARTTRSLRATLERTGRFVVTVSTTPPKGVPPEAWAAWRADAPQTTRRRERPAVDRGTAVVR